MRATEAPRWDPSWGETCSKGDQCDSVHEWGVQYRHVDSLDEAVDAVEAGVVVRDVDSDWVTEIKVNGTEFDYDYARTRTEVRARAAGFEIALDYSRFLVPLETFEPVTDEELAEVARSIAAVKVRK